jgi:hypothetical protein
MSPPRVLVRTAGLGHRWRSASPALSVSAHPPCRRCRVNPLAGQSLALPAPQEVHASNALEARCCFFDLFRRDRRSSFWTGRKSPVGSRTDVASVSEARPTADPATGRSGGEVRFLPFCYSGVSAVSLPLRGSGHARSEGSRAMRVMGAGVNRAPPRRTHRAQAPMCRSGDAGARGDTPRSGRRQGVPCHFAFVDSMGG